MTYKTYKYDFIKRKHVKQKKATAVYAKNNKMGFNSVGAETMVHTHNLWYLTFFG